MIDGMQTGEGAGGFDALDPKLTMFALANGMDIAKGEDYRRLEWFAEGLERAILVRSTGGDTFDLTVMSWMNGASDRRTEASAPDGLTLDEMSGALSEAIEQANSLGPPA